MGTPFVGRDKPLADLAAALEQAVAGAGGLVLVTGEAGIGKTRLCEELGALAARRGIDVTSAACWESGAVPAYWPWEQLVRRLGGRGLVPSAADAGAASADPDLARAELFETVTALLAEAAGQRPRLLVLDDLHWADVPSVRLLSHVTPALRRLSVLAVATFRPDEVPPDTPLGAALADLARHGDRVALVGLDPSELTPLLTAVAGEAPPAGAVEALYRHTHGNPLFARELVQLVGSAGLSGGDLPVPDTVRGVLHGRLARLSAGCRAMLEQGAVAGDQFGVDDLVDAPGALDQIDEAEVAGVLRPAGVGHWAFTHPLMRAVLYDELGVARRVRLHQRVGEALEARHAAGAPVDLAVLSHHFVQAAPAGTAAKAVTYALQAAARAMGMLAYEDAAALDRQALAALELAPDAADRVEVLLALGAALTASGDQPGARSAYLHAATKARAAGRPDQLARAALGVGSGGGFEVTPADREQVDLLEEALRALGDGAPGLWSEVAARLSIALWQSGQEERRIALAGEALATARAGGDAVAPRQLAAVLAAHCDAIPGPSHTEERVSEAGEVVDLGVALADRGVELLGRRLRLVARLEMGDMAGADAEIEAYATVAGLLRQPLYAWYVPMWRGMRALMRGDLATCERLAGEAAELGAQAHSDNAAILVPGLRWFMYREAGLFQEPIDVLAELVGFEAAFGLQMRVALALMLSEAGRTIEARASLDAAGPRLDGAPLDSEWLPMVAQAAEAACLLGDLDVCRWCYDALLPHRHRFGVEGIGAVCWGSVERPLGLLAAALGRPDAAADHFSQALAANRRLGAPLLVAHTERDAGVALGDRERLAAALTTYRELGVDGRVSELESVLGAALSPATAANVFRRDGEVWTVGFAGTTAHVKDVKGMADLAVLLGRSGTEVAAADLAGTTVEGDAGEVIDAQARDAYKARLVALESELDAADAAGDGTRSANAQAERDALLAQLSSAFGLGGRPRRTGVASERARGAVTWRIRDAIARIDAVHPELARHLRRSVRTGTWCAYDPDPPVMWSLTP